MEVYQRGELFPNQPSHTISRRVSATSSRSLKGQTPESNHQIFGSFQCLPVFFSVLCINFKKSIQVQVTNALNAAAFGKQLHLLLSFP